LTQIISAQQFSHISRITEGNIFTYAIQPLSTWKYFEDSQRPRLHLCDHVLHFTIQSILYIICQYIFSV